MMLTQMLSHEACMLMINHIPTQRGFPFQQKSRSMSYDENRDDHHQIMTLDVCSIKYQMMMIS